MKKKTLTMLLAASCSAMMLAACGNSDANTQADNQQAVTEDEVTTPDNNVQDTTSETATEVASEDTEFYFTEVKQDELQSVDLGKDGTMDNLQTSINELEDGDSELNLQYNDKSLPITDEDGENEGLVFYVHKSDGDYILIDTKGDSWPGNIKLYGWNNEAGSFVKIDELENRELSGNWNDGDFAPQIDANTITISGKLDVFGTHSIDKAFNYGKDGLAPADKYYKVYSAGNEDRDVKALVLKQSLTFYDDNGNATKTLEAGQKVCPYEANDPTDPSEGFKTKGNYMSFMTEDGEFLGHIEYDLKKSEDGNFWYNRDGYTPVVNGIEEDELFEGLIYAG
ncbi:MAG: hypothetical protein K5769_01300 [Pseudobutyrivibrio sp.]|nr:hypothetical protein [Pseudobutyrivibrio sp.]